MHRLLERLDASASTLVPLLYLSGLMLGAASYFAGITLNLGLAVGLALAGAAELHSFLQQRRARAAWARLDRLTEDDAEYEQARRQFRVNAWILVGLLAFSAFNATMFIAETWTPAPGPEWWRVTQIGIRGLIVPVFFFLAGFLVPLHMDASDQLRATSTEMLRRTLKAIDRQWRHRLKRAEKRSADLAPVAIALLQEAGDHAAAKRIALISQGLITAEQGAPLATLLESASSSSTSVAVTSTSAATAPSAIPTASLRQPLAPTRMSPRDRRRANLEADMRGLDADEYDLSALDVDADEEDERDWASSASAPADDFGAWDDDAPSASNYRRHQHVTHPRMSTQSAARRDRAQAAHMAPRGAELVVREFAMPDLPASRYEREGDTDQRRAVFRVLDQALAKHESLNRAEVARRAGVSENTVRSARPLWDERRSKRGQKRAAPRTEELVAITPDMLTTTH